MSALPSNPTPTPSKDVVAQKLADAHRAVDPAISAVFRIEAPGREVNPAEPVKLLEVNPNTTASGIMPVGLTADASSGILFPSVIVEIHPSELDRLKKGELKLPNGWTFDVKKPL